MPKIDGPTDPAKSEERDLEIRDLSDFCERWEDLKDLYLSALPQRPSEDGARDDLRIISNWLIVLADRVCSTKEW